LVKCNIATQEAVADMAKTLGIPVENIHYAGLKDKNAITAQALSFHNTDLEKVRSISSSHYFLKDLRSGKGSVEKGNLRGNRFTLFIRTPKAIDQAAWEAEAQKVSREGFYNFYYLQRFGMPRLINYQWGFDILRGRYKDCVMSALTAPSVRETPLFSNIRKEIASLLPDWQKAYALVEPYPLIMTSEYKILAYLKEHPQDYTGALVAVKEQVMLWVYGFASLLFNESLSKLIRAGTPIPEKLPLLLSDQKADIDYYADMLKGIKYYPPQFQNLKPFPAIQLRHRTAPTAEKITVEKSVFSEGGVALRFSLGKGEYATTFLSHLFNLISGVPGAEISDERTDTYSLIGNNKAAGTFERFKGLNLSKRASGFEEFENM
jgi:tRNA(Glu) U13 pseudouridine synthase TruD